MSKLEGIQGALHLSRPPSAPCGGGPFFANRKRNDRYTAAMKIEASTIQEYLDALPEDRRRAIMALRKVIKKNLPKGFKEGMQYGMPAYFVPHSVFPAGYHCAPEQPLPFASIASQKNHLAFYSFYLYQDGKELARFQKEWKAAGHKLDMGKSCVRFKSLENVPLDVIGASIARQNVKDYVAAYEKALGGGARKKATAKKKATKKPAAAKKKVAKKATAKKSTSKTAATRKVSAKKASSKKPVRKVGASRAKAAPARKQATRATAKKTTTRKRR